MSAFSDPWQSARRRWIPSLGTALLLGGIGTGAFLLRSALVTPKLLARAKERLAAGRLDPIDAPFKWEDAAVLGTHWASSVILLVVTLALLTMRWWHPGPPALKPLSCASNALSPGQGRYRVILLAIFLGAVALRLPLAMGSLWWDELWNIKFATVGEWRQNPENPDEGKFLPTSWSRAAWYYNKPTNHSVLTLPSKACHSLWQKVSGAAPAAFSELVLRLPVFAASLAALLLTARLATRLAGRRAGLTAAALMALHPWLIRYGVDARSYGLTLFFTIAALSALERATAEGSPHRNAWWWAFGGCQMLLMWAHALAHVSLCAVLAIAALWLIRRGPAGNRGRLAGQWLVIHLTAAAVFLAAFLPNALQALTWGERNEDGNLLTASYLVRTLSQIASGTEPPYLGHAAGIPLLPWGGFILLTAAGFTALVTGLRYLIRTQPRAAILTTSVLGGGVLFLVIVHLAGGFFYHRFVISSAIPVILLTAIGLSRLPHTGLTMIALAGFAGLTFPQTRLLLTRSYAPFRETIADLWAAAARTGPAAPIPVGYGLGSHVMQAYEPTLRDIRSDSAAKLQAFIDQARRENRPLYVALGYEGLNRQNQPEGFTLLDDPTLFERLSVRHGIEPEFTFQLLSLKPQIPPNSTP